VPKPRDPTSILSQHEFGLFEEAKCAVSRLGGYEAHRNESFNSHILPKCRSLIEAIGHRMAYEAAKDSGCNLAVLALYEKMCMSADLSWYTENLITTRSDFFRSADEAYENALPHLLCTLEEQKKEFKSLIYAPITDQSFDMFIRGLKAYRSNDVEDEILPRL
jgi:acyl-CoA oxidase